MTLRIDRLLIRLPAPMEPKALDIAHRVAESLARLPAKRNAWHEYINVRVTSAPHGDPGEVAGAVARQITDQLERN